MQKLREVHQKQTTGQQNEQMTELFKAKHADMEESLREAQHQTSRLSLQQREPRAEVSLTLRRHVDGGDRCRNDNHVLKLTWSNSLTSEQLIEGIGADDTCGRASRCNQTSG